FFFSSRRRHTRFSRDWSSDVCSSDLASPHPIKGYEVKAFVVCNDQNLYTERFANELFAYCKSQLAPYKIPRIIEFVTELPKTISGKIRRVELRAEEAMNKQKGIIKTNEFYYKK